MNIAVIAHAYRPIRQPFVGGLEAHTHQLVAELVRQDHTVTLFAKLGSKTAAKLVPVFYGNARDGEHPLYNYGYRFVMRRIAHGGYDLVINNSLNHTPLEMHDAFMPPMVTIFHTPPLPEMVAWLQNCIAQPNRTYIAVSDFTANQWRKYCFDVVHAVPNGMDMASWVYESKAPDAKTACWVGRITPEKGTHVAIEACIRLGLPLTVAGNIFDKTYFNQIIRPLLQHPGITYLGHLDYKGVNKVFSEASVAVVTPLWDEPFGLVEIEAWASGTPVAALPNGALPSLVRQPVGTLSRSDSSEDLAVAITSALAKDRRQCRDYALENFSLETMVLNYLYLVPEAGVQEAADLSWQTIA